MWLTAPVEGPATVLIDNCRPGASTEPMVTELVFLLIFAVSMGVDTVIRFVVPDAVRGLLDWLG